MSKQSKIIETMAESVDIDLPKDHPKNYRRHPDDQLEHVVHSVKAHGQYKNIVTADDYTILAGHGVREACKRAGLTKINVVRLDLKPNSPRALKILAGDNEIGKLGEVDDRALSEILKQIKEECDDGLAGTGFDDKMLANLIFVTRPSGEIRSADEAAQWVGMPDFGKKDDDVKITVLFRNKRDRERFVDEFKMKITTYKTETSWTTWWPPKERDDLESVKFKSADKSKKAAAPKAKKAAARKTKAKK